MAGRRRYQAGAGCILERQSADALLELAGGLAHAELARPVAELRVQVRRVALHPPGALHGRRADSSQRGGGHAGIYKRRGYAPAPLESIKGRR